MPLPLLGPALTAVATYAGYQATQAAGDLAAELARENARQLAKTIMTVVTAEVLAWSCTSAGEYLDKYCSDKTYYKEIDCASMVVKQIASCGGSASLLVLAAIHGVQNADSITTSASAGTIK